MTIQLFIGIYTEGTTDDRFLQSIVQRSFIEIAYNDCVPDIDIEVIPIKIQKQGLNFCDQVLESSKFGADRYGISVLCVHKDADDRTDTRAFASINNAIESLRIKDDDYCKIITPVVPIQMVESWMLADKTLFKNEIGTPKRDEELGINRPPEAIADPKEVISEAIRIARANLTKRRRKDLSISDLYLPIGLKVELDALKRLNSFNKFYEAIKETYRTLQYLA